VDARGPEDHDAPLEWRAPSDANLQPMPSPPISVKGVLIHRDRVLLLLNERGEWDLPGGRPDPGEDHRVALIREVREETGLAVEVGAALDEHMFEVLPTRFVRIVAYVCRLTGGADVRLSNEHLEKRWLPLVELAEQVSGHRLPVGYLRLIRSCASIPPTNGAKDC
jgi:8-oxo-dGTP diphosphatase